MAVTFSSRQGEIATQLEFRDVSFAVFAETLRLGKALFNRLSPWGLRLSDLKFHTGDPSYADTQITCSLFSFMGELQVKPDRIEMRSFDLARKAEMFAAVAAAAAAVIEHAPDITFRALTSSSALHGTIDGTSTSEFLWGFVKAPPPSVGEVFSTGVAYYFAPAGKRLMSSLTMEPSQSVSGGLYLRSVAIWDPSQDSIDALQEIDTQYQRETFGAIGIALA